MPLARVSWQPLSLWQSAVTEVMRRRLAAEKGAEPTRLELLEHPAVKATDEFVRRRHAKAAPTGGPELAADSADPHARDVYLSGLVYDIARARAEGRVADEERLLQDYWPFSDKDKHFLIECPAVYAYYSARYAVRYNDWQKQVGRSIDYGVIDWRLPADAKVGVIGDWGTGMPDAAALLGDLVVKHQPDAIIHLGDIYYSGLPRECQNWFAGEIANVFAANGHACPVFTLPGNHDYYALGWGFYPMLPGLNAKFSDAEQEASYFCLRTEDDGWQFLGMDTGLHDSNPADQVNPLYAGPWLEPSEIAWHRDKLASFPGPTIMLSHHQLFTANAKINGMTSSESEFPYLNPMLLDVFQPYFATKVAAWLWGHEHNFVLFQDGLFGLAKGRLLGASAFEEMVGESPYTIKYPNIAYLDPTQYQLPPQADGYYPHSYAVIDFSVRKQPTDPVSISYYRFPAWYQDKPQKPTSTFIFEEPIAAPEPGPQTPIPYGAQVQLSVAGGLLFVGPFVESLYQYYPTVRATPVTLELLSTGGSSGTFVDGSQVQIRTTESGVGAYNLLGAWSRHSLYYSVGGYDNELWTLRKLDTSESDVINYGDAFSIVSASTTYAGQWITTTGAGYLTATTEGVVTTFTAQPA